LTSGDPVISVDTRKKELTKRYEQAGEEWQPKGAPVDPDNSAWVSVCTGQDTSVFAVATIEQWWHTMGKQKYPEARRILITADVGRLNGHRWLWKFRLARLATATGLDIVVCHHPPGTRKWNRIERRLFFRITHNWCGRPLETYQTILSPITNTTTTTELAIHCELDSNLYPVRIKLTHQQKNSIPLVRHRFHGEWNYTIRPSNLDSREVG
jgi:hypothetical protein